MLLPIKKTIFLIFILVVVTPLSLSKAQETTQAIDITIKGSVENPQPEQVVFLEAISYGTDLSQASIVWSYNNKRVSSGKGNTSISVLAPKSGQTGTVTVTATMNGLSTLSASLVLQPGSVDILWEGADASVPPFYKGRPLIPVGGIGRAVAQPINGSPKQLYFSWQRNEKAVQTASGIGKSTLVFQNTNFETQESLLVSLSGATTGGVGSVTITPQKPFVIGYKIKGGFVDYGNGSLSEISAPSKNLVALFEPFFFSLPSGMLRDLDISLFSNEQEIYSDTLPNEFILSTESSGKTPLSIKIKTRTYTLQNITAPFSILWEQN